jgi:hypothetical protein
MMTEGMMKQMPHMIGGGATPMMGSPLTHSAMLASAGFAAGRGLVGFSLLRNPLVLVAGGLVAGYLIHKYEKEIVAAISKATGIGKDFVLQQKENLEDLVAEAQEKEAQQAQPAASAATPAPVSQG